MNNEIKEGDVVIVGTGQAGTLINTGSQFAVLLRNGDLWYGHPGLVRIPQSQEDLDAAPIEFDRFATR